MKNIIFIGTILCFLISFASCEKDNFEGPNAAFFGAVRDSVGGAFVEQDMISGGNITAYEHGYPTPFAMFWDFKTTGEFRNNLVFANTYDLYIRNANCFPVSVMNYEIKPGDNYYEFWVVPYLRIKDAEIKLDQSSNKIVATFKIEGGKPMNKLKQLTLYAFSDIYVGDPFKFAVSGTGWAQTFKPVITPDPATVYTLSIDLAANNKIFKSGRDYFFRIGAMADNAGLKSVKTNYAPCVKIEL
jgi:hypothetical protein